jgi:hypothetical protein
VPTTRKTSKSAEKCLVLSNSVQSVRFPGGSVVGIFKKLGLGSLVLGAQNAWLGQTETVGPLTFDIANHCLLPARVDNK